jgi:hypothetical protein
LTGRSDSGVYYRPGQVEYQVLDDIGSPYGENPRRRPLPCSSAWRRAIGEWNSAGIRCQGTVIEHWLNEQNVLSFDYTDPKWAAEIRPSASATSRAAAALILLRS